MLCEESDKTLRSYLPKVLIITNGTDNNHVSTNDSELIKNEDSVKSEDGFKNENMNFGVGEHNVLEILDQNVEAIKGDIKLGNYNAYLLKT